MRNYPRRMSELIHTPNTNHMLAIVNPPLYIAQRNPWQCGVATINGDRINPDHVIGTHKYVYKCDAIKCSRIQPA